MPTKVHSGSWILPTKPKMISVALTPVDVSLSFLADGPVVPGQPIPVDWFFANLSGRFDLGTGYRIRISWGDEVLYVSRDDPQLDSRRLPDSEYIAVAPLGSFEAAHVRTSLPVPACHSPLGQRLYQFGQRELRLELTTNGSDRGPYEAVDTLSIVPELVAGWWTWPEQLDYEPGLAVPIFRWKQHYNIRGEFANKSKFVRMDLDAVLEDREEVSGPVVRRSYPKQPVDSESTVTVALPLPDPIVHDWTWFDQKLSYPAAGPTSKNFYYTSEFSLSDCYSNKYPATTSAELPVLVKVPGNKVDLGAAAFAAQVSSWVLLALSKIPIIGFIFGIGATVAAITAQALGKAAVDPPGPNARFLRPVDVGRSTLPKKAFANDRMRPFAEMAIRIESIANAMVALSEIEARLQGARLAKSKEGESLQTRSYRNLLGEAEAAAKELPGLTEEAITALESFDELKPRAVKKLLSRGEKRRSPLARAAIEASRSSTRRAADVEAVVASRATRSLVSGGIGLSLRVLSSSVLKAVMTLERDARLVLNRSGEEHRRAP
jgi:hypothetical protein